jgi:PKD repeat protein
MTIPNGSTYPQAIDTDQNLWLAHDSLRMTLAEDYNPGDTSITVVGDPVVMRLFPPTGLITLTEQCSDPELRAISFYYGATDGLQTFSQLELLPGFKDVPKPKNITHVTQNVMASHHNVLADALIKIEEFAGRKGEVGLRPLEGTMEQRINYLRNIALAPKAWFTVDKTIGLAPLSVTFTDLSFRLGTDGTSHAVTHLWDFGDNTGPSVITIDETGQVQSNITNVLVNDVDGGPIQKTYTKPGIYSVSLTVTNDFGSDTVTLPNLITARFPAPDEAVIDISQRAGQLVTPGQPVGGPYITPPHIRSVTNNIISVGIDPGINTNTGKTNGGETVDNTNTPIDPITTYTWAFSDDLTHSNSPQTTASFSVGGVYDLTLRVDTRFGAYRITTYPAAFDIVEQVNLWLWYYGTGSNVASTEFGLISETFKTTSTNYLAINVNDSFLTGQPNEAQQKQEFHRNVGFVQRSATSSGSGGVGLLYWASGRNAADSPALESIPMAEYSGFLDTYTARPSVYRPWNWVDLGSPSDLYFILGGVTTPIAPNTSPTNQVRDAVDLSTLANAQITLNANSYKNGGGELMNNVVTYDNSGVSQQGNMSVYRSCWRADSGYFLRNSGVGQFFRIRSFYKTSGSSTDPFVYINKLPDMTGSAKVEGELVSLSQGVYFFSNSGSVAAYSPVTGVWGTGGPWANAAAFRGLQDTSVIGFDNANQTLLAASDGDSTAYLSFDYSPAAFVKFNESDTTFSGVTARPSGAQWQMTIF